MEMKNFVFSVVFNFVNFMKKRQNLKNATLREVWPWHLMLKICKIKKKKKKNRLPILQGYFFRGKRPS